MRGGNRADRMLREVETSVPPLIVDLEVVLSAEMADVLAEIAGLDVDDQVLHAETISSSEIEGITAGRSAYRKALAGGNVHPNAIAMAALYHATEEWLVKVERSGRIELDDVLDAHRTLMADDLFERRYAGRLRDMQNWIGGSDWSPRGAVHVPPPPDTVSFYMADLIGFANRDDVPPIAQAAIAHAQFESIHPFTDGNGRIGRSLVQAILRRRGATRAVVPLSVGLAAAKDGYFSALAAYRDGDFLPLLQKFAQGMKLSS